MQFNHLHAAFRALTRRRTYTLTSIIGLGIGMATCLLIVLFVMDELSYDLYHEKKDRIFRLVNMETGAVDDQGIAKVNGPWGTSAKNEIPEVEEVVRFVQSGQLLMTNGTHQFYESTGLYADPSVFNVFKYRLLEGDPATALKQPNTVVITKVMNEKYFGQESGLGKLLDIEGNAYSVTGILEDVPLRSHFTFTYLLSMASLQHPDRDHWVRWNQFYTYILLRDNASVETVISKMKVILARNLDTKMIAFYSPALQPLTRIHLYSHLFREMRPNSDVSYIYIFSSVALLILIISAANFINLFTAQAASRGKEIGVRKVNGAIRRQLITQFLVEASVITFLALLLAHLLAPLALPTLNELTDKNLHLDYWDQPLSLVIILGMGVVTALLAGSYPALYLSSLKPVVAIKGKWTGSGSGMIRKGLVTFQFALSSVLVIASVVILQQLDFIQSKPLGFDPQQIINIPIHNDALRLQYETVKRELLQQPGILSVSTSGNLPGGSDWGIPSLAEGFTEESMPHMRVMAVDHDFLETYGIQLVAGRGFTRDLASDTATYLINEEAARQLHWDQPLTKTISMPAIQRPNAPVVGIVKDFHFRSLKEKIGPLLFMIPPASWYSQYSVRVDASHAKEAIQAIEKQWERFDPEHPFIYNFFDQSYNQLYQQEHRLSKIVTLFTAIGVFLACLGLYSLASLTTEQRTKEIGIRKVIGATNRQIVMMLSGQYVMLVLIGFFIALPLSLWLVQQWLQTFAYQIDFNVMLIIVSCMVTLVVALTTVSYRSLQAAWTNPVDALRDE